MISQVHIQRFRGLRDVKAALRPLTVLIGPNDSGKSSFLEAIEKGRRNDFNRADAWRFGPRPQVELLSGGSVARHSVAIYRLPAQGIPMESEGVADPGGGGPPTLNDDGGNVAAYLDYLLRRDRTRFDQVQESLRHLIPGLENISIATPASDKRALVLQIDQGLEIAGERLSAGVRMLLFFVALAHHPAPPDVILLEEPENGVHPRRLEDIVGLLRGITRGELSGHASQVILTTHSPYLLDFVKPPDDQVLVFRRDPDGARTAVAADADRLRSYLDEFMLGEVWFNQGEEGLVRTS